MVIRTIILIVLVHNIKANRFFPQVLKYNCTIITSKMSIPNCTIITSKMSIPLQLNTIAMYLTPCIQITIFPILCKLAFFPGSHLIYAQLLANIIRKNILHNRTIHQYKYITLTIFQTKAKQSTNKSFFKKITEKVITNLSVQPMLVSNTTF